MRIGRFIAAVLAVALVGTACSKSNSAGSGSVYRGPGSSNAISKFGYAPSRNKHVQLQSDVVLIGGGPKAIKRVSSDGLMWTMDGNAPGVKDLKPGKIMFASGTAVGKVLGVRDDGPDRDVVLGPVDMTDIIKNGDLKIDQPLNINSAAFQAIPAEPGALKESTPDSAPSPGATATPSRYDQPSHFTAPGIELVSNNAAPNPYQARGNSLPNPSTGESVSVKVGNWSFSPNRSGKSIGVTAKYEGPAGLAFTLDLSVDMTDPRIRSQVNIHNGQAGISQYLVSGIRGIHASIKAGSAKGLGDNQKFVVDVPVDLLTAEVPVYGIPTVVKIGFKLSISTGFSVKNSTLSAKADIGLSGNFSYNDGGTQQTPAAKMLSSVLNSIKGLSLGANGMVVALKLEAGWGLGVPMAMAGPSLGRVMSFGVALGAMEGLVQCKSYTILVTDTVSFGISVSSWVAPALREYSAAVLARPDFNLGPKPASPSFSVSKQLYSREFFKITDWSPKVHACQIK